MNIRWISKASPPRGLRDFNSNWSNRLILPNQSLHFAFPRRTITFSVAVCVVLEICFCHTRDTRLGFCSFPPIRTQAFDNLRESNQSACSDINAWQRSKRSRDPRKHRKSKITDTIASWFSTAVSVNKTPNNNFFQVTSLTWTFYSIRIICIKPKIENRKETIIFVTEDMLHPGCRGLQLRSFCSFVFRARFKSEDIHVRFRAQAIRSKNRLSQNNAPLPLTMLAVRIVHNCWSCNININLLIICILSSRKTGQAGWQSVRSRTS